MIVVKIIGGLGNQLFQYALARKLSIIKNIDVFLDISEFEKYTLRTYQLNHFNVKLNLISKDENKKIQPTIIDRFVDRYSQLGKFVPYKYRTFFKESSLRFDKKIFTIGKEAYLDGYWQSERYFQDIRDTLLTDLTPRYPLEEKTIETAKYIRSSESVCIHIRRGDYVTNPTTNAYHGLCSLNYYLKSIEYLVSHISNTVFFVFSDDIEWAKKNLKGVEPVFFVENRQNLGDIQDFYLMTQCKHFIIANSSFSWWGAWLSDNNEKMVIAPKTWFTAEEYDATDLVPDRWIRL